MTEIKKEIRWPRREHLVEALDVFDNFREACKFQLDLGYWMTITIPSKHHLNKILSTQYINQDLMREVYGINLTTKLLETVPLCKAYLNFIKEGGSDGSEKNKK